MENIRGRTGNGDVQIKPGWIFPKCPKNKWLYNKWFNRIKTNVLLDDVLEQLLVLNDYLDYCLHLSTIKRKIILINKYINEYIQIDQILVFLDSMKLTFQLMVYFLYHQLQLMMNDKIELIVDYFIDDKNQFNYLWIYIRK